MDIYNWQRFGQDYLSFDSIKNRAYGLFEKFFPKNEPIKASRTDIAESLRQANAIARNREPETREGLLNYFGYLVGADKSLKIHGKWVGPNYSANKHYKVGEKFTREDLKIDPVDFFDSLAKKHDIQYGIASTFKDESKRNKLYLAADKEFIDKLSTQKKSFFDSLKTLGESGLSLLSGIVSGMVNQDIGGLLVSHGINKFEDFVRELKENAAFKYFSGKYENPDEDYSKYHTYSGEDAEYREMLMKELGETEGIFFKEFEEFEEEKVKEESTLPVDPGIQELPIEDVKEVEESKEEYNIEEEMQEIRDRIEEFFAID